MNIYREVSQRMIYIGTSGFSYDDWRHVFYPPGLAKRDFLTFYSRHFPALELNSSFYAIPSPRLIGSLIERTPNGFQIAVKAYRGITHERNSESEAVLKAFLDAIAPLIEVGKLAAILLQFPYSFHFGGSQLSLVESLLERMSSWPTVVEFRNERWMKEKVWEILRSHDTALCCVDEPRLPGLVPPETICTSAKLGYVRFHGRNAEKWWNHKEAWERYDYLYREEELEEWRKGITWLAGRTDKTFIFFNNHRNGQAVENARDMGKLLGVPLPGADEKQQGLF